MEPDNVRTSTDIVAAADRLLNAPAQPVQPITTPAAALPGAGLPDDTTPDAPIGDDAGPDATGEQIPEPDAALEDPMADRERQMMLREAQFEERERLAKEGIQSLLKDPKEYEKARRELGFAEEAPPPPARPTGPDPIEQEDSWRYRRTQVYREHYRSKGEAFDADAVEDAVERDLVRAQNITISARMRALEQSTQQRAHADRESAAQSRAREAREVEQRAVEPLLAKAFPKGPTADDREQVEAFAALARSRGQKPDYAKIVEKVAGVPLTVVRGYIRDKKVLASRTLPTTGRGGQAPAPTNPVDNLPADTSSIYRIGDMLASGKLK